MGIVARFTILHNTWVLKTSAHRWSLFIIIYIIYKKKNTFKLYSKTLKYHKLI